MIEWQSANRREEQPVFARDGRLCARLCKIQNMKQIVYCTSNAFLKGLCFLLPVAAAAAAACYFVCVHLYVSALVYNKSLIHHRKQW